MLGFKRSRFVVALPLRHESRLMRASARLIRVALALAYLAQVAPNAHAPSGAAPGGPQPPASRLSSSKLARSLSDAGRDLQQLRLVERARGGEVKAEEGAEAAEQQGGRENSARDREAFAAIDRTRRGFYPRVYEAIPEAEGNAAWSKCSLGSACARRLRLLRARLAALGSSALPGREAGPVSAQPLPRVLELAAS